MVVHVRRHTGERPFKCHLCPAAFVQASKLAQHIRTHTGERPFSCVRCNASFSQRCHLLRHMSTHLNKNEFSTGQVFSFFFVYSKDVPFGIQHVQPMWLSSLTATYLVACRNQGNYEACLLQSGARLPRIAENGGSLSSASRERYHSLVSVQGELHSCRQCTYVTKYSANMRTHLRTHTGERPFQCHLCPAAFFQKIHLAIHIRTHTGERPYSCDVCSASFSQKIVLVRHMRTHTGERPFCCDHCDASFSHKDGLVRHMRIHTEERPFSCDHCSASFSRNLDLRQHVSRRHANKKR
ncbi:uncharacterized protein LOC142772259 [Rhipicephalus microplus]|uniref:uncharacterized protein LOC142772259 n=1 Tax=Rhipicephalus microplus TaxID=6941 RepID=UPI003F6BEE9C